MVATRSPSPPRSAGFSAAHAGSRFLAPRQAGVAIGLVVGVRRPRIRGTHRRTKTRGERSRFHGYGGLDADELGLSGVLATSPPHLPRRRAPALAPATRLRHLAPLAFIVVLLNAPLFIISGAAAVIVEGLPRKRAQRRQATRIRGRGLRPRDRPSVRWVFGPRADPRIDRRPSSERGGRPAAQPGVAALAGMRRRRSRWRRRCAGRLDRRRRGAAGARD